MPTTRAIGLRPYWPAACSEATSSAQAPSFTPEALPAVTVRSGPFTPFSLASCSSVVCGRGCSSAANTTGSPFLRGMVTLISSSAKRPAASAAAQRCCERSAKASWSARLMLKSAATLSAVCGMECVSYSFFIIGLMKRQPIVVSYTALLRLKALSALGMTKGARLMLSTPPAIIRPASPALMLRAARPMASMPEPHRRFTVVPGTSTGRPASRPLMRATLRLSSPAWLAQP